MRVLTPEQMRDADAQAIAAAGDDELMRAAGLAVAERIAERATPGSRIVAFAGPGNNGGDAFAALAELDAECEAIVYAAPAPKASPARAAAERRARAAGVRVRPLPESFEAAAAALEGSIAIDALFGTGSRLPLPEPYRPLARALDARRHPVIAIDLPSGVDALTGAASDDAVAATETVTVGAVKPGLLLDPARERCGALWYAPIGFDERILASFAHEFASLDDREFERALPRRARDSDKRASGAPLLIAGSSQFPGAAVLCALAAARAGAGYVTIAAPAAVANVLRAHLVEQVVVEIDPGASPEAVVEDLIELSARNGSIGIGPGLGLDERTGDIVAGVLARTGLPVVADASALFHLSKRLELLRGKRAVLTPHAGEFARLSGGGTIAPGTRVARLREFVARTGIATLLKGADTLIDDGTTVHINTTGTPALATAGTGDVLTGIVATLLAQGLPPVQAASVGAYWHGLAGQVAAQRRAVGAIASDLIACLADALPSSGILARRDFALRPGSLVMRVY